MEKDPATRGVAAHLRRRKRCRSRRCRGSGVPALRPAGPMCPGHLFHSLRKIRPNPSPILDGLLSNLKHPRTGASLLTCAPVTRRSAGEPPPAKPVPIRARSAAVPRRQRGVQMHFSRVLSMPQSTQTIRVPWPVRQRNIYPSGRELIHAVGAQPLLTGGYQ